jgi:hypothetical protein
MPVLFVHGVPDTHRVWSALRPRAVDRLLPLHGRMVPLAEPHRMIGRAN